MNNTKQANSVTRRRFLALSGGAAILSVVGTRLAHADSKMVDEAIEKLLGERGQNIAEGPMIKIDAPEIAENGNTVPIKFEVDSPMTAEDYVKNVHLFADGNPRPEVANFHFTPASGKAAASTRMRLATTQNVVAVVEMSDGKVFMAKKAVKVTIGGCGG